MAKLKAPLLSLGASGAIGKTLVFFDWKGLNVVREYVIPTDPNTTAQSTHRALLTDMVAKVHLAMGKAANMLGVIDKTAYSLLGSLQPTPRTWFNTCIKQGLDQLVQGLECGIYRGGTVVATSGQLVVTLYQDEIAGGGISAGVFFYGVSKTAMLSQQAAVVTQATNKAVGTITGLINGTKYFVQFKPTLGVGYLGNNSGIYYGTPSA